MIRFVQAPLRRLWAPEERGSGGLAALLVPPALAFGAAVRVRNRLFDVGLLRAREAPVPVLSVGNLSVGGSGKTPVTRWIVELLLEDGRRPAVVARGYGEDEMELHRRWNPDVPVIAAPRRLAGTREAAARGADVCVLDDGFQHRWLARDLDLLLLSADDPFPPRLLPRGPYREPLASARRADLILVTSKTDAGASKARGLAREVGRGGRFPPVYPFPLRAGPWATLAGDPADAPGGPVLVVSSVARPEGVAALARERGVRVADHADFPDHHPFDATEVEALRQRAEGREIVTTEKDAVKLFPLADRLGAVRVLTLHPDPEPAVRRALRRAIEEALDQRRTSTAERTP